MRSIDPKQRLAINMLVSDRHACIRYPSRQLQEKKKTSFSCMRNGCDCGSKAIYEGRLKKRFLYFWLIELQNAVLFMILKTLCRFGRFVPVARIIRKWEILAFYSPCKLASGILCFSVDMILFKSTVRWQHYTTMLSWCKFPRIEQHKQSACYWVYFLDREPTGVKRAQLPQNPRLSSYCHCRRAAPCSVPFDKNKNCTRSLTQLTACPLKAALLAQQRGESRLSGCCKTGTGTALGCQVVIKTCLVWFNS